MEWAKWTDSMCKDNDVGTLFWWKCQGGQLDTGIGSSELRKADKDINGEVIISG